MDINQIDWSEIWRNGKIFFAGNADKASSWDHAAARWNNENADDYGKKVIQRIKIKPDWTVLDVGCGPGLLAIPMAKKSKHLTALDVSSEMLKYLKENAEREKVSNIKTINIAFETAKIGKDVERHDIVVVSRSMGWEHNLEQFLRGMNDAAKKRAYVVWGASDRHFDIGLYNAIGRPYGETRTYIVIYNLLYQMGIRANIEIFQTKPTAITYNSVDEAQSELSKRFQRRNRNEELTPEEKNELEKYLKKTLAKSKEGNYRFNNEKPTLHALIWWDKRLS
jgi:SAM-dependent methyltransferase